MFSIKELGTKFIFPGQEVVEDGKKASIVIRPISNDLTVSLLKKHTQIKSEFKQNATGIIQHVSWEEIDEEGLFQDTWDFIIMSWANIQVDNKDLPCTRENKLLLLGKDNFFAACVIGWRHQLEKDIVDKIKGLRKN